MLFYLTNLFLDVIWGTAFWVIKKTSSGVYYRVWGDGTHKLENDKEYDMIILSKEEIESEEKIQQLVEQTKLQGEQIKLLTEVLLP